MMSYKLGVKEQTNIEYIEEALTTLRVIMDPEEAREFITSLGNRSVALDFETTGLVPMYSKVRLSCIYHPDHGCVLLDHMFCGAFNDIAEHMLNPMWVVYNAKFEWRWFNYALGADRVTMLDVDYLAKTKLGGYP